jgi:hypothetical protein
MVILTTFEKVHRDKCFNDVSFEDFLFNLESYRGKKRKTTEVQFMLRSVLHNAKT